MLYLRRTGFPKGVLSPFPHSPPEIAGPQSNQRGIETRPLGVGAAGDVQRLNRTSVGLKRGLAVRPGEALERLNRTSVGLKRFFFCGDPSRGSPGLNRTSVGLKRNSGLDLARCLGCASIEPAWD